MKRISFIFVFKLIAASYCFCQQDEIRKKLESFNYFAGTWTINIEARLSAQGPWDTSVAISVFKLTTGSKILEEDLTGTRERKPFLIKMLLAVNNLTGSYQRIFADSEHGALVDYEGIKNERGFLFDKLWIYPGGSTVKLRVVYTIISNDEFTVENMRMPQGTTEWDVTGRMKYKRMK